MSNQINLYPDEIHYFRKGIALLQIGYYLSLFYRVNEFFGANGWMKITYRDDLISLLVLSESNVWRWVLISIMFVLLIMLYKGILNRIGLIIYYLINLSFYLWNPYILHEPQPLTNILFISFLFLPMTKKHSYDPWIKNILIVFLGVYYFFAGIRKLPDINFMNGTALEGIITWTIMAKNVDFNLFFVKHFLWIIRLMNYLTLIFEMSFIFLIFSRFRVYLIIFGVLLHTLIYMTLEVGNLSFVMLVWYLLLLDNATCEKFKKLKNNILSLYPNR